VDKSMPKAALLFCPVVLFHDLRSIHYD
jgi:hypothetical protein